MSSDLETVKTPPNKGAAPNAGGRRLFAVRTPRAARVGELGRYIAERKMGSG